MASAALKGEFYRGNKDEMKQKKEERKHSPQIVLQICLILYFKEGIKETTQVIKLWFKVAAGFSWDFHLQQINILHFHRQYYIITFTLRNYNNYQIKIQWQEHHL